MANFSYTALDAKNAYRRGTIQARSQKAATKALVADGLSVITIKQERGKSFLDTELSSGFGLQERILFTRHLHTMLEAGIALDQSLKTMADQTTGQRIRQVVLDLHQRVQKGQPFHQALAQHPKYFTELYISLVKVGELSGKLDEVLLHLLEQQEKDYALRTKVMNAMLYPTIILIALFMMVSLMLVFVIPRVASVLAQYDVDLPIQTKILLALSKFMENWWFVVVPGVLILVWLIRKGKDRPAGKRIWDSMLLGIPGLKTLVREINLARFTRTMHATLKSGLSIDQALELSSTVVANTHYRQSVRRSVDLIRRGAPLGEILQGYPKLYPPITTRMVAVGEKTGKLDHMLNRLAIFYETSVDTKLSNLSSIIEPFLILIIGLVVGFVAISVMTPIWSFSQTI